MQIYINRHLENYYGHPAQGKTILATIILLDIIIRRQIQLMHPGDVINRGNKKISIRFGALIILQSLIETLLVSQFSSYDLFTKVKVLAMS